MIESSHRINQLIIKAVGANCGVPAERIIAPKRQEIEICDARHIAISIIKKTTPELTTTQIGRYFSDRGRQTVINALRQAENLVKVDKQFRHKFETSLEVINKIIY